MVRRIGEYLHAIDKQTIEGLIRALKNPQLKPGTARAKAAALIVRSEKNNTKKQAIEELFAREETFDSYMQLNYHPSAITPEENQFAAAEIAGLYWLFVRSGIKSNQLIDDYLANHPQAKKSDPDIEVNAAKYYLDGIQERSHQPFYGVTFGTEIECKIMELNELGEMDSELDFYESIPPNLLHSDALARNQTILQRLVALGLSRDEVKAVIEHAVPAFSTFNDLLTEVYEQTVERVHIEERTKPSITMEPQIQQVIAPFDQLRFDDMVNIHFTIGGITLDKNNTQAMDLAAMLVATGLTDRKKNEIPTDKEAADIRAGGRAIFTEDDPKESRDNTYYPFFKQRSTQSLSICPGYPAPTAGVEFRSLYSFNRGSIEHFAPLARIIEAGGLAIKGAQEVKSGKPQYGSSIDFSRAWYNLIAKWENLLLNYDPEHPLINPGDDQRYMELLPGQQIYKKDVGTTGYEKFIDLITYQTKKPEFKTAVRNILNDFCDDIDAIKQRYPQGNLTIH